MRQLCEFSRDLRIYVGSCDNLPLVITSTVSCSINIRIPIVTKEQLVTLRRMVANTSIH